MLYLCCDPSYDETVKLPFLATYPFVAAQKYCAWFDKTHRVAIPLRPVFVYDPDGNEYRFEVERKMEPVYRAKREQ